MGYPDRFFVFLWGRAGPSERRSETILNPPYIVHPVAVAIILSQYTDNCNLLAAGFLHDFLEDVKGYGRTEILKDFGVEVLRIVEEVTEEKTPGMSKEEAIMRYHWER